MKNEIIFKVDLLKGQGLPRKNGPGGMAIVAVNTAIPVIAAFTLLGLHSHNKVMIPVMQKELTVLEERTDRLSDAVALKKDLEREKVLYGLCLSEVKSSIDKFTQWSPILATLLEHMPASVSLNSLEVTQESKEIEVPKKDNPKKKVTIKVPVTKLQIVLSDNGKGNCDQDIRDYRDKLRASEYLGSKLEKIDVPQRTETVNGKSVVLYEINCLFKMEL